jgi:hypothetical protein
MKARMDMDEGLSCRTGGDECGAGLPSKLSGQSRAPTRTPHVFAYTARATGPQRGSVAAWAIVFSVWLMMATSYGEPPKPLLPADTDAEKRKAAVSLRVSQLLTEEQKALLEPLELQIDDLHRALKLPSADLGRLKLAAQGAVTGRLDEVRASVAERLMKAMQAVPVTQLSDALEGQGADLERGMTHLRIWQNMLATQLSAPQLSQWKVHCDQRQAYRCEAMIGLLMLKLSQRLMLDQTQQEKLKPLLSAVMTDYWSVIQELSADQGYGVPGTLPQSLLYGLLPGVPEPVTSKILNAEQQRQWKALDGDYDYWSQMRNLRQQKK